MRQSRRRTASLLEPVTAPPPKRRGIVLRQARGTERWFFEVEYVGELERLREHLTRSEYDAAITLRQLWVRGTMNPEATSSCLAHLGLPPRGYADGADELRLEAQDELRAAVRAMGSLGMAGRFAIEVVAYERRARNAEELLYLRDALSRLAEHLRQAQRAAA